MKERIRQIRKNEGYTQSAFGDKLGVKGNTVTSWETGIRIPSEAIIKSICREFHINETWLRKGEGEMMEPVNRDAEDLLAYIKDIRNLVTTLSRLSILDDADWDQLEQIVLNQIKV